MKKFPKSEHKPKKNGAKQNKRISSLCSKQNVLFFLALQPAGIKLWNLKL